MLRIALTGPHGTGKTTLSNALVPRLSILGRVAVCREAPRLIIERVGDADFFRRGNNKLSRQALIFLEHVMEERRAERDAEVVISDRTLIDHLAYTLTLFPESATSPEVETYKRLAFESLTSYHFIFQIPIEFLPEDDGVREPDPRFQRQIGDVLTGLYTQSGVTPVVIRGSVEERAAQVQVHLEAHNLA